MIFKPSYLITSTFLCIGLFLPHPTFAQEASCEASVRRLVTSYFQDARQTAESVIQRNLRRQVDTLRSFYSGLTPPERQAIEDASVTGLAYPLSIQQKLSRLQRQFNLVECDDPTARPRFVEEQWICRHQPYEDTDAFLSNDNDPKLVREIYLSDSLAFACTIYIRDHQVLNNPDSSSPAEPDYAIRSCTRIDLLDGSLAGETAMTSVDETVVDEDVYAFIGEISILDNLDDLVQAEVNNRCH
jgi:hypothetical protein